MPYFNTSHVSINHEAQPSAVGRFGISIHLMFLLITSAPDSPSAQNRISIHLMFLLIFPKIRKPLIFFDNFNTSHVSINRADAGTDCSSYDISIHLMFLLIGCGKLLTACMIHFNTSHVSINRGGPGSIAAGNRISIHLMFLLILDGNAAGNLLLHFNTSHVSINLLFLF